MGLLIENLKIGKYNLSGNINDGNVYVVYAADNKVVSKFLLYLSGINQVKEGKILYNGKDVFDNSEFFSSRIYVDMNYKYINSLSPSVIKDTIKDKYNIEFDVNNFKKKINLFNVRKEVKFNGKYIYSDLGKSLLNYCFLSSTKCDNYIIDNLFVNIKNTDLYKNIVDDIISIENEGIIISANSFDYFLNKNVKYIIFGDYEEAFIIDPKIDKFVIVKESSELKNRLFKQDNGEVICHIDGNDFLKKGFFRRMKYKEISFDALIKYRRKSILNYEKVKH